MPRHLYSVGDSVFLKTGGLRSPKSERPCRILSVLPETYGMAQYRIRFDDENCERRITEAEIDNELSTATGKKERSRPAASVSSWINPSAIKTRK
ncbi:cold-shock protein [Rhizobium sp. BK251]|uniref:cold-shock protein n=1 Tax=Rhizobium sp. BK251 TaxID=2512125 RepID=UPI0010DC331D|nr:cold-shock protein [Rhizobium sp. BK251]TCL64623.1 hypothetical protein EV286_11444 [Rhizobium sp. BK251]